MLHFIKHHSAWYICMFVVAYATIEDKRHREPPSRGHLKWLKLSREVNLDDINVTRFADHKYVKICSKLPGITRIHLDWCHKHTTLIYAVAKGGTKALKLCKILFRNRRWNCTGGHKKKQMYYEVLSRGTREAAFLHAITSAGVADQITRMCAAGISSSCGCLHADENAPRPRNKTHPDIQQKWGGCSHNVEYGVALSKKFVDARERKAEFLKRRPQRALMNLHNNDAGRKHILEKQTIACKCAGHSGSCAVQNCWRRLQQFTVVGRALMEKFDGAIEVDVNNRTGEITPRLPNHKQIESHDLVYMARSPYFCDRVSGRECNKTSKTVGSCNVMCCGRGYNQQVVVRKRQCRCKFIWCCEIRCEVCRSTVVLHTCK